MDLIGLLECESFSLDEFLTNNALIEPTNSTIEVPTRVDIDLEKTLFFNSESYKYNDEVQKGLFGEKDCKDGIAVKV
jgi:hypothetical protein